MFFVEFEVMIERDLTPPSSPLGFVYINGLGGEEASERGMMEREDGCGWGSKVG